MIVRETSLTTPDFFIVGAPKCGTTAMDHYLKQHPEIFLPNRKEPQFFGSDLHSPVFIRNWDKYLSLFEGVKDEKRVGETSVRSLHSEKAAMEIKGFQPGASIIAMLRNPVETIPSMHSQYLYTGNENIESLKEALEAEEERKRGKQIPKIAPFVQGLFYKEAARYSQQIQRYFEAFGRENVHVIIFDDFKANPAAAYARALRFLGVDSDFRIDFQVINSNKRVRNTALRNLSKHPRQSTRKLVRALVPTSARHAMIRVLDRYNTRYETPQPVDQEI